MQKSRFLATRIARVNFFPRNFRKTLYFSSEA